MRSFSSSFVKSLGKVDPRTTAACFVDRISKSAVHTLANQPKATLCCGIPPFLPVATPRSFLSKRLLSSSSLTDPYHQKMVSAYNQYYDGKDSIYYSFYHNTVIPRDRTIIRKNIFKAAESLQAGNILRVLDYGCGDGRYFAVIEEIALELKDKGIHVEFIGYDPSRVGLEKFEERVQARGAQQSSSHTRNYRDIEQEEGGEKGYIANILENKDKNITVKLIHGHIQDKLTHIEELIGQVSTTICMFGVLSHIQERSNRVNLLRTLGNITNNTIVITLPGSMILKEEKKALEAARRIGILEKGLADKMQDGDTYYSRVHGQSIFYHLYETWKEVVADMGAAGLEADVSIQKILHEKTLTKYPLLGKVDEKFSDILSRCASEAIKERLLGYYLVEATRMKYFPRKESGQSR